MFVISLHLHKNSDIGMYWHYKWSTNRFCVNDMVTLWSSNFIVNWKREYILHWKREYISSNKWTDTISPFYTCQTGRKTSSEYHEELEEKIEQYKRLHAETRLRTDEWSKSVNAMQSNDCIKHIFKARSVPVLDSEIELKCNEKNGVHSQHWFW